MTSHWLPQPVLLSEYGNVWKAYTAELHDRFQRELGAGDAIFLGHRVTLPKELAGDGKLEVFHHCITKESGASRILCPIRCERLCWIRAILDNADSLPAWRQRRSGDNRVVVALDDFSHLVVLNERKRKDGDMFYVLITSYDVKDTKSQNKYRKEFAAKPYKRQRPPL